MTVRKPTALKLVEGNRGRRPMAKHEPMPAPLVTPRPPAHLDADGRRAWRRLYKAAAGIGTATVADVELMAITAATLGDLRRVDRDLRGAPLMIETTNGNAVQNPLIGMRRRMRADALRLLREFGLSPSGRAGLDVIPPPLSTPLQTPRPRKRAPDSTTAPAPDSNDRFFK